MTDTYETDVVVVGSGPAGAGVARDLTRGGHHVTVLEMGRDRAPTGKPVRGALHHAGGLLGALTLRQGVLLTKEWLTVLRGVTTGGSSMLYLGTAHDPDPAMWTPFGFDLQQEAQERKDEIGVATMPDRLIGDGAHAVGRAARDLGYGWGKFNKFIDPSKCVEDCNVCIYGCHHGAKWHARDWVLESVREGARLMNESRCERVLVEDGKAVGVRVEPLQGEPFDLRARRVVLAAGGVGSPAILRKSGVDRAGESFFFDPFVMTTGVFDEPFGTGVMMATGVELRDEGVLLSDMQYPLAVLAFQALMAGELRAPMQYARTLPIMIKIRDDMTGAIDGKLRLNKELTPSDRDKLELGKSIAERVLRAAGARRVWHSRVGAAHPGGTCAMGTVVDESMQTPIEGLFVCDASVVPVPFGIPPTLTCLALSKRLARHLDAELGGGEARAPNT
jgi:choline dehydrogenase-like flavoprotein